MPSEIGHLICFGNVQLRQLGNILPICFNSKKEVWPLEKQLTYQLCKLKAENAEDKYEDNLPG